MSADARELGARIAARRRTLRLTQEELAEHANVNLKSVQGVEQGRTEPELRTMRRIARVLDTTIDALAGVAEPTLVLLPMIRTFCPAGAPVVAPAAKLTWV